METNGTEKTFRLSFKQSTKGVFTVDWSVRAETIEELQSLNKEVKQLALEQVKELNGG